MNLSRPHHSRDQEPEVPVDLPNVVVTVAADGTLTAAVDSIAHPQPASGTWTRATFGPLGASPSPILTRLIMNPMQHDDTIRVWFRKGMPTRTSP